MAKFSNLLHALFNSEFKISAFGGNGLAPEYLIFGKRDPERGDSIAQDHSPKLILGPANGQETLNFGYWKKKGLMYHVGNFLLLPEDNRVSSFIYCTGQGETQKEPGGLYIDAYHKNETMPEDISYKEVPMSSIW